MWAAASLRRVWEVEVPQGEKFKGTGLREDCVSMASSGPLAIHYATVKWVQCNSRVPSLNTCEI